MKIVLSTGSVEEHDPAAALRIAREAGIDGVELIATRSYGKAEVKKLNDLQKKTGKRIWNVHMPFFTPRLRNYILFPSAVAREMVGESVGLASALGARNLVVHPFPTLFSKESTRKLMAATLAEKREPGLTYAVENLEVLRFMGIRFEPYCITEADELYGFSKTNDTGMTLDTTHCMTKGIHPEEFFLKYRDRIVNVHLSNHRDGLLHRPLGDGAIDFVRFIKTVRKSRYEGCLTLETVPRGDGEVKKDLELILDAAGR